MGWHKCLQRTQQRQAPLQEDSCRGIGSQVSSPLPRDSLGRDTRDTGVGHPAPSAV